MTRSCGILITHSTSRPSCYVGLLHGLPTKPPSFSRLPRPRNMVILLLVGGSVCVCLVVVCIRFMLRRAAVCVFSSVYRLCVVHASKGLRRVEHRPDNIVWGNVTNGRLQSSFEYCPAVTFKERTFRTVAFVSAVFAVRRLYSVHAAKIQLSLSLLLFLILLLL